MKWTWREAILSRMALILLALTLSLVTVCDVVIILVYWSMAK